MPDRCGVTFVKFGERHSCVRVGSHDTHKCGCGANYPAATPGENREEQAHD